MDNSFSQQALGAGSAAEALMDTNPSFTVIKDHTLQLTDYISTYRGAGVLRIRRSDINGAVVFLQRVAADGQITGDFKTPLALEGGSGDSGTVYVITQEGSFINSLLLVGTALSS